MIHKKLKKGYDIKVDGISEKRFETAQNSDLIAVKPDDFIGLKPKLMVKEGDSVQVGSPLFYHKENDSLVAVSPASGTVEEIIRGDRRKIEAIVVRNDGRFSNVSYDIKGVAFNEIVSVLKRSGIFVNLKQRPYGIIPDPEIKPRDIFISVMDTSPLAADQLFLLKGKENLFQKGLDVLALLTDGTVHLVHDKEMDSENICKNFHNVELHSFKGKHPAGNSGVHIHHIAPVKDSHDVLWTVPFQTVLDIGYLYMNKTINNKISVAVAGPSAENRFYYEVIRCAQVDSFVKVNHSKPSRIISGDVLTGSDCTKGFISWNKNLVTVIPEIVKSRFVGWLMPGFTLPSFSRTYVSWYISKIFPSINFKHNSGLNGGLRAFIVTGEMEKVLPMDIYPMYLIKSILAEEIEEMEALGIYEVIEEDFALCEYIDPSKNNIQAIIRQGLDLMIKEG